MAPTDLAVRVVQSDGVDIPVRHRPPVAGGVPAVTLLLLHGWPGTGRDWDGVLAAAVGTALDEAEILVPDLRGFGASVSTGPGGTDPSSMGPEAHAADMRAVLTAFGAQRVVVGGYDLGATVAQRLRREGAPVQGLVLGCPVYPGIGERRFEPAVQAELWYQHFHNLPWADRLVSRDRVGVETYLRHFYTHWWGTGAVDEEHFQSVVDTYSAPGAFEASIGWYRARAAGRQAEAALTPPPLAGPTVVLWGEKDAVVPFRFADRLGEFFDDVEVVPLPASGHFVPLEAPGAVTEALVRVVGLIGGR